MKKEKLLVKEINVLVDVICKKVKEERDRRLEEKMKKDKGYVMLEKKIKEFNKKVSSLRREEEMLGEEIGKINKRLGESGKIGYSGVLNYYGKSNEFRINKCFDYLSSSDVYNKLMVENIDGDLKVDDLINRMVKEMV